MTLKKFKEIVRQMIFASAASEEDWPKKAAILREIADEADREYEKLKGEQP